MLTERIKRQETGSSLESPYYGIGEYTKIIEEALALDFPEVFVALNQITISIRKDGTTIRLEEVRFNESNEDSESLQNLLALAEFMSLAQRFGLQPAVNKNILTKANSYRYERSKHR